MNPVTIGIPCFNNAQWLRACIDSALAQSHPDCEIIVVDDGSADDSPAIAASYGSAVRLIVTQHEGAPAARNRILHGARGEWLQYLDADDMLLPSKIELQLKETGGGANADVIYSPVIVETPRNGDVKQQITAILPEHDLFAQWLGWQLPQTGGALWRRTALENLGGWKLGQPCCQEHELYLRALQTGLRFAFAPTPGAVYRIWSDDTLCRRDPRLLIRVKAALIDEMASWLKARGLWTKLHRMIAGKACFEMARTLAKTNLKEAAAYHCDFRARGLIHVDGPAAPPMYRLAYAALGFAGAERIARATR